MTHPKTLYVIVPAGQVFLVGSPASAQSFGPMATNIICLNKLTQKETVVREKDICIGLPDDLTQLSLWLMLEDQCRKTSAGSPAETMSVSSYHGCVIIVGLGKRRVVTQTDLLLGRHLRRTDQASGPCELSKAKTLKLT